MLTRLRIVILAVFALMLSLSVSAQRPTPSALTLARLTPSGTMLYASVRTDPGFVETLDGLIARISEKSSGFPVSNALGALLTSEGVRGWLGDSVALFVLPPVTPNDDPSDLAGILVEITDNIAAAGYLEEQGFYVLFKQPNGDITFSSGSLTITVTDHLMLMGGRALSAVPFPRGATLADSPRFQQALTALPAGGDYPAFGYFDPRGLIIATAPEVFSDFGPVNVAALADSTGVFAAGLRQLDGQTYTLDLGWAFGEGSSFAALYLPELPSLIPPPLNIDFLNVVPADAQLVLHGAQLWSQVAVSTRASGALTQALRSRLLQAGALDFSLSNPLAFFPAQWTSAFSELSIRGSLNLTPEQLSAALDGDAALALRLTVQSDSREPKLLIEPGAWFASRDNGSADLLTGGANLLDSFGVVFKQQVANLDIALSPDFTGQSVGSPVVLPPSLVWLATDALTYLGADALTLENKQTLVAVPRITDRIAPIRPLLLEGQTTFAWADIAALAPLFNQSDVSVQLAAAPFDSLFISARQTEDTLTARFAFRLK